MGRPLHSKENLVVDYHFPLCRRGLWEPIPHELMHSGPGHMRRGPGPVQEDLEDTAKPLLGLLPCLGSGGWMGWGLVWGGKEGRGEGKEREGELHVGQAFVVT